MFAGTETELFRFVGLVLFEEGAGLLGGSGCLLPTVGPQWSSHPQGVGTALGLVGRVSGKSRRDGDGTWGHEGTRVLALKQPQGPARGEGR